LGLFPVPLVNPKIAGKWMFIPLKMVLIGIDPYPYYTIILIFYEPAPFSLLLPLGLCDGCLATEKKI
jgi:hypothetical protein